MRIALSWREAIFFTIWIGWLGYLAFEDVDALLISVVFVLLFGFITCLSMQAHNIVLKAFSLFMFIGHAIGAPFLWLNRSKYGDAGFSSVGAFQFNIGDFFLIYLWVIPSFLLIVLGTMKIDTVIYSNSRIIPSILDQASSQPLNNSPRKKERKNFDLLLVAFIALVMIPLNVYMSTNNIGFLGVLNDPLPYRLTGITYYMRLFFAPLLILLLFFKSSRSWYLVFIILGYSIFAGISSASRTVFLLSLLPVGYFTIVDRQKFRFVIILLGGLIGFLLTGASRDYTYGAKVFVYSDAIDVASSMLFTGDVGLLDTISGIANRLYGAQDMILAYQFIREDNWLAMLHYFISGGRADSIVPNLGRDLFDINLEGTGLGVGIGTMAYLLILGHSDFLTIPFFILILSFMISVGNLLLNCILMKAVEAKFMAPYFAYGPIRIAFGGYMAFSLYSSSLNNFYTLIELITLLLAANYLFIYCRKLKC